MLKITIISNLETYKNRNKIPDKNNKLGVGVWSELKCSIVLGSKKLKKDGLIKQRISIGYVTEFKLGGKLLLCS